MTLTSYEFETGAPLHVLALDDREAEDFGEWVIEEEIRRSLSQWIRRRRIGIHREVADELAAIGEWLTARGAA